MDTGTISTDLDQQGWHCIRALLDVAKCEELIRLYDDETRFRKKIVMAQHGYGSGEYQYFDYPLPPLVADLRTRLYPHLAAIANTWGERLAMRSDFPPSHAGYLNQCAEAGQTKATPLMLKYVKGDFNRLHQDLYGEHVFPLQLTVLLSKPGQSFTGGEFILTEQRPRMQSRVRVIPLDIGDAVIFPVRYRPGPGPRGFHRINMRHGVSNLNSGQRFTLGIIFHDAA